MANRFANLNPNAKINQDFSNITLGFDKVQTEIDAGNAADADLQQQISDNETDIEEKLLSEAHQRMLADQAETAARISADNAEAVARQAADEAHEADTTAHPASSITYNKGTTNMTSTQVEAAIREAWARIEQIITGTGGGSQEVVDARNAFANLKARLDAEGKAALDATVVLQAYADAIDAAQANLARQAIHSGVLDYVGVIRTSGNMVAGEISVASVGANQVKLGSGNFNVNGYRVQIPTAQTITLPAPPTYGTREDLVFLEAWFPQTGPKNVLSWRIRTVAGVDFGVYSEGLGTQTGAANPSVTAQGGNASPIAWAGDNRQGFRWLGYSGMSSYPAYGDVGLYISGDGSSTYKTTLLSADGYVYAIPLFRVKRRNSGGWRKDNLSGALSYGEFTAVAGTTNLTAGETRQVTFNLPAGLTIYDSFKAGQIVNRKDNSAYAFEIISLDASNKMTIKNAFTSDLSLLTVGLVSKSDRPDGLFANVIDASDITDLRHKVSLTGFDYNQVVEESFDKVARGEVGNKTTARERYGLERAPHYVAQELMETEIVRADGTRVKFKNVLGVDGNCEDTSKWVNGVSSTSLDSSNKTQGNNGFKVTLTSASPSGAKKTIASLNLNNSGYYLVVADAKNGTATTGVKLTTEAKAGNIVSDTSKFAVSYLKLSPSDLQNASNVNLHLYVQGNASGQYGYFDAIRIYEIDAATYALIDVDANWTGGDKIAALFPYVDSYPNVVENLFPPFTDSGWIIHANAKVDEPYKLTETASAASQSNTFDLSVVPNTNMTLTAVFSGTVGGFSVYDFSSGSQGSVIVTFAFTSGFTTKTFTIPANCTKIRVYFGSGSAGTFTVTNPQLELGSTANPFVPYGKHYLNQDAYGNAHLHPNAIQHHDGVNGGAFTQGRQTFSDALTSEAKYDTVEALKTPQSHIKVTQATEGIWAIGDTIKVRSDYGIVSGIVDADTAVAVIIESAGLTPTFRLNDVSKIVAGDQLYFFNPATGSNGYVGYSVQSVDATNNTITFTNNVSFAQGTMFIETTASTSLPTVTAAGIGGTWANLGTKEATYTITTPPTTNTAPIQLAYSVTYPAGKGMVNVPTDILSAEVNGQKLVSGTTVSLKDNFVGKVSGNTDACPHVAKWAYSSSLLTMTPSSFTNEFTDTYYRKIASLDGDILPASTLTNGQQAGKLFSKNLIELSERKYGEGIFADCADMATKIAKLKGTAPFATALVSKITCNWWGYGSGPSGNKAYLKRWSPTNNNYYTDGLGSHANGSVTKLVSAYTDVASFIASDGFVHFLAYADASDGVTASTINTDHVEIEVELNVAETGYTVLQPENPFPVWSENLLTQNQAFPVDVSGFSAKANATLSIDSLGVIKCVTPNVAAGEGYFVGATTIKKDSYYTASLEIWGTGTLSVFTYDGTTMTTKTVTLSANKQKLSITCKSGSSSTVLEIHAHTNPTQGTTFYTGNIKLQEGPIATPWTPGRKKKMTFNFQGKIAGSVVENPHSMYRLNNAAFQSPPSSFAIYDGSAQTAYNNVAKQDGVLHSYTTAVTGNYAQNLHEFDLSHLGMSLKELKAALRKITVSWTGYGVGDNAGVLTNGAAFKVWQPSTSAWVLRTSGTLGTPETITTSFLSGFDSWVTKDQKVYVLVHSTYPAGAASASGIYTDYIKLDVELADYVDLVKSNVVLVQPETKTVKLKFPARSYKLLGGGANSDNVALNYRYVPYQGQGTIGKSKIVAVGTPIITTLGTGGKPSDSDNTGLSAMSVRLPSPVQDYNLVADKFTSEGVLTTLDSLTLKHNVLSTSGYRLTPKPGIYFDPANDITVETVIRGSNLRPRLSSDMTIASNGQANYKFSIPTTLPSEALVSLPILVNDNGELKMVVVSFRKSKSSVLQYYSYDCVYDSFRVPGRILVKGV